MDQLLTLAPHAPDVEAEDDDAQEGDSLEGLMLGIILSLPLWGLILGAAGWIWSVYR